MCQSETCTGYLIVNAQDADDAPIGLKRYIKQRLDQIASFDLKILPPVPTQKHRFAGTDNRSRDGILNTQAKALGVVFP